jgi:hypothetical protein
MKNRSGNVTIDNETEGKAEAVGSNLPSLLRAFRQRNYRLFFGGQFISLSGTWMQSVAQSWLVYRLTGSAVLLGGVGFMGQIPVFLFAPFGALLAGVLGHHLGTPITVALGGGVCILGAVVFGLRWPAFRHEARQMIVSLQMSGGSLPEEKTGAASVVAPQKTVTGETRTDA